jgi:hypothetical protein
VIQKAFDDWSENERVAASFSGIRRTALDKMTSEVSRKPLFWNLNELTIAQRKGGAGGWTKTA